MPLRLSLKTKFTLTTALLVLGVVALISSLYVATLTRQVIRQTQDRTRFVAHQVFLQAQHALNDAATQGAAPASESPDDLREYVRKALDEDQGLTSLIDALVGYSEIYEVTIADQQGRVLTSSDSSLPGRTVPRRPQFGTLAASGFFEQLRALYGPQRVYEVRLPFDLSGQPFGEIRVAHSTALMREAIARDLKRAGWLALGAVLLSTLLAALVSHVALLPLKKISAQLDRISQGEFEPEPLPEARDELGQVSTKISKIGLQLRGVREIFSTLRENLNQIMAGLEDGLLLFTRDGRAVLVSPAVEKFLGAKPEALLGRRANEIFPPQHPLRDALRLDGDLLEPTDTTEVRLDGAAHTRRVGVSVQIITERGTRMGALVTLRDLESLERIGSQLQVSERLAALGRVTAGVAHEVKNPLNSMRLWLENLRECLPPRASAVTGASGQPGPDDGAHQAVKILNSEIDRLDRVVKTFLDFTRPVDLHMEDTLLPELIGEVVGVARPQIERAGVEVLVETPADFPPVRADRQLLKQAVLNLVLNACEAMAAAGERAHAGVLAARESPQSGAPSSQPASAGKLTLRLKRRGSAATPRGAVAELTVADTGPGIAPEFRPKIFQLFFTTRAGGNGIGLATTFRIVQLHNGSIDFESEVGRGTAFHITLPLAH